MVPLTSVEAVVPEQAKKGPKLLTTLPDALRALDESLRAVCA